MRICYLGTFEADYPRNITFIRGLREAGVHVIICNRSVSTSIKKNPRSLLYMLGYILSYIGSLASLTIEFLKIGPLDGVIIGYPGHLDVIGLYPALKLKGVPFYFNPLVSLYDTFVSDRQTYTKKSLPARLLHLVDRFCFTAPRIVFWDTKSHMEFIAELFGTGTGKFAVVPVGAEEEYFNAERAVSPGCFEVFFFGKYIPLHGIEVIVEAARMVQEDQSIRFTFVGTGQEYAKIRRMSEEYGMTNIRFIDWMSRDELTVALGRAHVVLGIFRKGGKAARVVPNKVFQAMAAGAVVITAESPAIDEWFIDGQDIFLVEPENPGMLAEKIRFVKENYTLAAEVAQRGRAKVRRYASEKVIGETITASIGAGREI